MTRREAWASAGGVFVVALIVRAWAAAQIPFPIPEDATYYWGVARNLVEGQGLVSDAIWSYVTPAHDPLTGAFGLFFPRPAFEIWLPLPDAPRGGADAAARVDDLRGRSCRCRSSSGRSSRCSPGGSARTSRPSAGCRVERARTLALGSGLVSAVALPLVLPSALLDSTLPSASPCWRPASWARACSASRAVPGSATHASWAWAWPSGWLRWPATRRSGSPSAWAALAWWQAPSGEREPRAVRARLVLVPAAVAVVVVAPWLIRQAITFGSPLPGQAITNAWAITGLEIFAWKEPATLAAYLAAGPAVWLGDRVGGFLHNLVSVLVLPGMPIAAVGLAGLPWVARSRTLRLLVVSAVATFAITTLAFPVQTTWGTYLHASVPADVLIIISGLAALDAALAWIGRRRAWTRPVAWLGPLFAGAGALLFLGLGIPAYGANAAATEASYASLPARFAALGDAA